MRRSVTVATLSAAFFLALAAGRLPAAAQEQQHPWLVPDLQQQAKAEGALTVYGSMNEGEALPLWKLFEDESGIKVSYVRGSDTQIRRAPPSKSGRGSAPGISRSPPSYRKCRRLFWRRLTHRRPPA